MHFKALELFGFKSFADKTRLKFEPGVTAVVGPNGVGKSNIADAIRWVLGEQSAKSLRGNKMEDVIFSGTEAQEAFSLAEVSLTLANDNRILPIDYNEVTITRRIFRSGESEYLLNKTQVRLRDIEELFMGTGIGTNSYSIIEQGKIDLILSSKPEDRRFIFEEASGITKYKSRRNDAMRKLEQTEGNLLRVNDIIAEVRRQISSIERQAAKAERYKEEFKRLKSRDVALARYEEQRLNQTRHKLEAEINDNRIKESHLVEALETGRARIEEGRRRLGEIERELAQTNEGLLGAINTADKNQAKITLDKERLQELVARESNLKNELEGLSLSLREFVERQALLKKEVASLDVLHKELIRALKGREDFLSGAQDQLKKADEAIKKARLDVVEAMAQSSKTKNDLAKAQATIANQNARLRRLTVEQEKTESERAVIKAKRDDASLGLEKIKKSTEEVRLAKDAKEKEFNQTHSELEEIEARLLEVERVLTAASSKLEFLEDLKRRYAGFSSGVKALVASSEGSARFARKLHGVLADLIEVEPEHAVAIELALGEYVGAVVVDSSADAKEAIAFLKERNLGKATFLPLDMADALAQAAGNGGVPVASSPLGMPAINYINCDARYLPIIAGILDGVYISPEGIVYRGSSVTGGAQVASEDTSPILRDVKLKELHAQVIKLSAESKRLNGARDEKKTKGAALQFEIQDIFSKLRAYEIDLANKESECASIEKEYKRANDELSLLDVEINELEEELSILKSNESKFMETLKELDGLQAELTNLIARSQKVIETRQKDREDALIELSRIKTELASLTEKEDMKLATLKMMGRSVTETEEAIAARKKEIADSEAKRKELSDGRIKLEESLTALAEARKGLEAKKKELGGCRKKELDSLSYDEANIKAEQSLLDSIRDTIHKLSLGMNESSFELTRLCERIMEAYKVDLKEAIMPAEQSSARLSAQEGGDTVSITEAEREALTKEIARLREKLEGMGTVNLVAIEELRELQDRFNFLTKQQGDLLEAKDSLLKTIHKLNQTSRALFLESFQKIQETFKEYYKLLFGGGSAEIVLIDEGDVLESGIEIVVRPPGKRLQNIALLSGGEKALTAIALLFAIFKVKPSPFCVLDEIDAPLDESNIDRFTRVLKEFVRTSQFIIITHNKKTISMADIMYGVTMETHGISKMVSVKFADERPQNDTAPEPAEVQA